MLIQRIYYILYYLIIVNRVVIKQLPITATDEMLKNLVKGYGDIKMIDMTRTAKGSMIAFVEFYSESSKNSILDFNGGNIVVDGVECPLHNYYPYYPGNVFIFIIVTVIIIIYIYIETWRKRR